MCLNSLGVMGLQPCDTLKTEKTFQNVGKRACKVLMIIAHMAEIHPELNGEVFRNYLQSSCIWKTRIQIPTGINLSIMKSMLLGFFVSKSLHRTSFVKLHFVGWWQTRAYVQSDTSGQHLRGLVVKVKHFWTSQPAPYEPAFTRIDGAYICPLLQNLADVVDCATVMRPERTLREVFSVVFCLSAFPWHDGTWPRKLILTLTVRAQKKSK